VDAGAHAREVGLVGVRLLEPQREQHRGAGRLEDEKATIAGPADDAAVRLRRQPAHVRAMPGDQLADGLIPPLRLQRGRASQVGEDQREDARNAGRVGHAGQLGGERRILMARRVSAWGSTSDIGRRRA
jgi:hypothetical protein